MCDNFQNKNWICSTLSFQCWQTCSDEIRKMRENEFDGCYVELFKSLCRFYFWDFYKIVSHENIHVKHKYSPLPATFWIIKAGSSNMFQSEDIDILSNLSFIWELNHSAARLADSEAGYFLMISVSVHRYWGWHRARDSRDWLVIIGSDMSDICIVCFIIKISNTQSEQPHPQEKHFVSLVNC